MKKTKHILKKCDFISPEITLFYNHINSHSSIFSGILSIILLILIILLIIYLSLDLIKKKNPNSFYYTKFIDDVDSYPLNSSSLLHYLGIFSFKNLEIKINTRAINIIGLNINDGLFLNNSKISNYSHWIYENCEDSDLGYFKDKLSEDEKKNFSNCLCISKYYDIKSKKIINKNDKNFIYPSLNHGASRRDNFEYGIYYIKCQNDSNLNNNNCLSKSEQDNFINEIFGYEIYFIDHSINIDNYKEPIINSVHRITSEINSNSYVLNHLNFHPILIKTKDGLFLDSEKTQNSYSFDYNEKITQNGNIILGSFNFWIQNTQNIYDRTYKKIQDIAGGVDGIIEIVMLIVKFINNILLGGYFTLKDFSFEINRNVNIKNKNNISIGPNVKNVINIEKNSNSNNKGYNKKFINDTKTFTSNRSFAKKKIFITNSNFNDVEITKNISNNSTLNFENKIQSKKNLNWYTYFLTETKIRIFDDVKKLEDKREEIISEEKLIEIIINVDKILKILKKEYNELPDYRNITKEEIEIKDIESENNMNTNNINYTSSPSALTLNKN